MTATVTVLMPVFNGEAYVRLAIESVLAQTYTDFELLVVDDGSTDDSPQILDDYAKRDARVRVVHQPNQGVSRALNVGIYAAKGSFVARMDADDIMLPQRLAVQVRFLQEHRELGFCASYLDIIDKDGKTVSQYRPKGTSLELLAAQMRRQEPITFTHPSVTYSTNLARDLGGYISKYEPCEDTELFGRMISVRRPGLVIPEVLLRYRMHGGSISGSKIRRQIEMLELVRRNFYRRGSGEPEILPEHLGRMVAEMSISERLLYRSKIAAWTLKQTAAYDYANGRRMQANLRVGCAAAIRPLHSSRRLIELGLKAIETRSLASQ